MTLGPDEIIDTPFWENRSIQFQIIHFLNYWCCRDQLWSLSFWVKDICTPTLYETSFSSLKVNFHHLLLTNHFFHYRTRRWQDISVLSWGSRCGRIDFQSGTKSTFQKETEAVKGNLLQYMTCMRVLTTPFTSYVNILDCNQTFTWCL